MRSPGEDERKGRLNPPPPPPMPTSQFLHISFFSRKQASERFGLTTRRAYRDPRGRLPELLRNQPVGHHRDRSLPLPLSLSPSLTLQRNLGKSKTVLAFLPPLTGGHMKRPSAPCRATARHATRKSFFETSFNKPLATRGRKEGKGRRWFISENVKCAHPAASNGLFAHSQRRGRESRGRCPLFSSLNQFVSSLI